jgi:hypothetical protein
MNTAALLKCSYLIRNMMHEELAYCEISKIEEGSATIFVRKAELEISRLARQILKEAQMQESHGECRTPAIRFIRRLDEMRRKGLSQMNPDTPMVPEGTPRAPRPKKI